MDKRALSLEIDLLLKKINARHQKMMGYGADIPEGFAELLQQEVLTLYKKYVQLEFILHTEQQDALPYPEQQVQAEPKPAVAVPEPQPQPETKVKPEPQPDIKPEAKTTEEPQPENIKTTPALSEADADSIVKLVQQALSAQGEPRINPFATPQPAQVPQPKIQPEEKPAVVQQSQPEIPKQQLVQPPVKPVSTPAPALKQDEDAPLTLADKLRMQGIADLRKAIPIADKFLYMNELFQGEINHYNQALERFNNCSNALEARDLFESMKQHFEWDENSKTVKRFADLLTRKFL